MHWIQLTWPHMDLLSVCVCVLFKLATVEKCLSLCFDGVAVTPVSYYLMCPTAPMLLTLKPMRNVYVFLCVWNLAHIKRKKTHQKTWHLLCQQTITDDKILVLWQKTNPQIDDWWVVWFQILKHEDLRLFSVLYHYKFNLFEFWTVGRTKQAE